MPAWLAELRGQMAATLRDLRQLAMALLIALGVIVGRHIEGARTGAAYIGTRFILAFVVVLVPDSYEAVDVGAGIERFYGVICGIALLYPVLLLTSRAVRASSDSTH